jgi:hypothetical protein
MRRGLPIGSEEVIHIPLAVYSGSGSILGALIRPGAARGALVTLYVKSAGTSTLLLRISGFDDVAGNSFQPTVNYTITTTGIYVMAVGPGVALQPPGEGADTTHANIVQAVGMRPPGIWRISVGKGDTSAWELGCSVRQW